MADHEATGGLADVDAVVTIGGMPHDPFVFFVEGVHGRPGECDSPLKLASVARQVDVLPCPSQRAMISRPDCVPGRQPKIVVPRSIFGAL
jgi:hypothetical protein